MLLIMANIVFRLSGRVIPGSYELSEIMSVVIIGFALGYTALKRGHVNITFVISRFSQRTRLILDAITTVLSIVILASIAWVSVGITYDKALLGERTSILLVSYIPFRYAWVFGLVLFCFVLLIDLYQAVLQIIRSYRS